MHSRENSAYRLDVAKEALDVAEAQARAQIWPACLNYSQQTVENAGKAIVLLFRPIARTHDIDELLDDLLDSRVIPKHVATLLRSNMDLFRGMGMDTHTRAAYGDEEARITPSALIQEQEAESGLRQARRALALAQAIFALMTGEPKE